MTLMQLNSPNRLRRLGAAIVLAAAALPAMAITFGTADGSGHPNVGSMVVKTPNGVFQWCSGTLIAPQVFLTASHCTQPIAQYVSDHPDWQFLVTFDPVIDTTGTTGTFYTGTPHTNPLYGTGGQNDPHDIAVITLDSAPPLTPASLPTAGLFDAMKASGTLNGTRFTAVGYGSTRDSIKKGPQGIDDSNVERQTVDQGFRFLTDAWLTFDMLPTGSNNSGGTCYGDSGGPHFLHDTNGTETEIVAAITITGDAQCKSSDKDYRTDSPSARAFLADFVTLP